MLKAPTTRKTSLHLLISTVHLQPRLQIGASQQAGAVDLRQLDDFFRQPVVPNPYLAACSAKTGAFIVGSVLLDGILVGVPVPGH